MNNIIQTVTNNIIERSKPYRDVYLQRLNDADSKGVNRSALGCSNLAHGFAACSQTDKDLLSEDVTPNIAIVSAYNDMLSAHQPFASYPDIIKQALKEAGATGQFAGGVPAMCDGVTQSQPGMELSLFSRDVIAQATAIALSHNMFDGALYLGVCDKIVPGLLIGALNFGHLPAVFVPGGPMPSGISNTQKVQVRQDFAKGLVGEKQLLASESASYHSPGTCTFYGTANSNQMLMEIMGLHLPGSSFVTTNTLLRDELTKRAAGIVINWQDFHDLAQVIPLLTKLYPNGSADVNHFHQAGGMPVVIKELLDNELLHDDVHTILGKYKAGKLNKDFVAVVRYQGPKSNGMPELHGLLPALGALQDEGFNIAIVTDGRMSGASGKVASAIHMTPEACEGGLIAKIETGDVIRVDVTNESVELLVSDAELEKRDIVKPDLSHNRYSMGRELFASLRQHTNGAEEGACIFSLPGEEVA